MATPAAAAAPAAAPPDEAAEEAPPQAKFRKDYQPLPYSVETVHLNFDLREEHSTVTATLALAPNARAGAAASDKAAAGPPPLVLNGRADMELVSVRVDGGPPLEASAYRRDPALLTLLSPPAAAFELEVITRVRPQDNSSLEGLYKSGGNFSTQCEAEGFRGITFFPDRPDVMARYTTRIEADAEKYPVLLSNGDLVEQGSCGGGKGGAEGEAADADAAGRHFAVWKDPFPKPCYLFALVAGDLVVKEDAFRTASGRDVALKIFTQPQSIAQVGWAMESLKASMRWDEEAFGLEYDLGIFQIVAVDDFNMGAMENKSLNIFNSRLVLADKDTSSDGDYGRIQGVVGHEYFHNWTGESGRLFFLSSFFCRPCFCARFFSRSLFGGVFFSFLLRPPFSPLPRRERLLPRCCCRAARGRAGARGGLKALPPSPRALGFFSPALGFFSRGALSLDTTRKKILTPPPQTPLHKQPPLASPNPTQPGNRVTCRDWFQLTLKEGLTVYRDQEFSADLNSRAVKRIEDAARVRAAQFSEDSGPMAHPVRPDSYIKMDNFYTVTVYEKGAEVVRLYETILGKKGFRRGMDLYFARHDGAAVTCDDFLNAMADANPGADGKPADLFGVAAWYGQAGTPRLTVSTRYDAAKRTFEIVAKQATPPTPGQAEKGPVMIPLRVGLLGPDGADLPLTLASGRAASPDDGDAVDASSKQTSAVLLCDQAESAFVFSGVESEPVASLLRGFSAPVKMAVEGQTDAQLVFLFAHDSDPFVRWDAGQRLALKLMERLYHAVAAGAASAANGNGAGAAAGNGAGNGSAAAAPDANAIAADEALLSERCAAAGGVPDQLVDAFRATLADARMDGMFRAFAVSLPSLAEFVDAAGGSGAAGADGAGGGGANPLLCHAVRHYVNAQLAQRLRPELEALVAANDDAPGTDYVFDAPSAARRALKNKALGLLSCLPGPPPEVTADLLARFRGATNMTDRIGALACLADTPGAARDAALDEFWRANEGKPLNLLKWLAVQAGSGVPGNADAVQKLSESHPAFVVTNPNCCYSLYLGFARSAPNFHAADGSGYAFLADAVIRVDKINSQVASRLVGAFTSFRQYDPARRSLLVRELGRIAASRPSANVYEIVSKSLETAKAAGITE